MRPGNLNSAASRALGAVTPLRSVDLSLNNALSAANRTALSTPNLNAIQPQQKMGLAAANGLAAAAVSPAVAAVSALPAPNPLVKNAYAEVQAIQEKAPALAAFSGNNGDLKAASSQSNRVFDLRAQKPQAGLATDSVVAAEGLTRNPSGTIDPFYPGREKFEETSNDLTRGLKAKGKPSS